MEGGEPTPTDWNRIEHDRPKSAVPSVPSGDPLYDFTAQRGKGLHLHLRSSDKCSSVADVFEALPLLSHQSDGTCIAQTCNGNAHLDPGTSEVMQASELSFGAQ